MRIRKTSPHLFLIHGWYLKLKKLTRVGVFFAGSMVHCVRPKDDKSDLVSIVRGNQIRWLSHAQRLNSAKVARGSRPKIAERGSGHPKKERNRVLDWKKNN